MDPKINGLNSDDPEGAISFCSTCGTRRVTHGNDQRPLDVSENHRRSSRGGREIVSSFSVHNLET